MSPSPVVLILGAGANIGQSTAKVFASQGYKVALASRSTKESESTSEQLHIPTDLSNTNAVVNAFARVKSVFGAPSVVVYNAAAVHFTPPDDPLSLSLADFKLDSSVNIESAFVAAQQAVQAFAELPPSASRTFIYTGNILNRVTLPGLLSLGVGKSATAYLISDASAAYKGRGYKFYYADERKPDGSAANQIDGAAHAELFWQLASQKEHRPWLQTFVKGEGYRKLEAPSSAT